MSRMPGAYWVRKNLAMDPNTGFGYMIVIRVMDLCGRAVASVAYDAIGKFIVSVDDIDDPTTWRFTEVAVEAKVFEDMASAFVFYRAQSKHMPMRLDGRPNRPLTAFSVIFTRL